MADLLGLLRAAGDKALSGADLARRLGVSRAAVHKRVEALRAGGHAIVGVNRLGYRLGREAAVWGRALFQPGWGRPFHHFASVGSTQEAAKAGAAAGEKAGALFVADRQTAGRGRLGRSWSSPAGGLWYSLLLRPAIRPDAVPALALAAALDWARLLRARGVAAAVKWPNDVWVEGRKLAGVLTEMSAEPDRVHWAVLGVGVNVNNAPPAKALTPAVSLKGLTGAGWPLPPLLADWMARFRETCRAVEAGGFGAIRAEYARHSALEGAAVSVATPGGEVAGSAEGVDEAGRLLVRAAGGIVALSAGDVRVRVRR